MTEAEPLSPRRQLLVDAALEVCRGARACAA